MQDLDTMVVDGLPESLEKQIRLGDYLVEKKLISQQMLEAALAEQRVTKDKLGLILTRSGFISRQSLLSTVLELHPENIKGEQHFTLLIPPQVLIDLKTMIVAETDAVVYVGTMSPEPMVKRILAPYYPRAEIKFVPFNHEQLDQYLEDLRTMASDKDSLVERILRKAITDKISDVHIIPRGQSYSVFNRYLGVRHLAHEGDLEEYNALAARIKDLSRMDLAERRVPQDGSFSLDYNGKIVDMRVATLPSRGSEYIVIRLLDPDRVQPSLDLLGISKVAEWRKGVSRPDGLCLICGPTGSGKTTTLNASVKEMDRFGKAIFSVEDPVEYGIAYTGQVNVNHTVGLDFARAVRAFMRSDPDVIILGEVRDTETARNALKAAETGHLVLATLHTESITGALQRLKDLEVPQHELMYLLRTILVQRLVRVACPSCFGKGCPACGGHGYAGRQVVSECAYFAGPNDVKALMDGKVSWELMIDDAVNKAVKGITTKEEVVRIFGVEAVERIAHYEKTHNVTLR